MDDNRQQKRLLLRPKCFENYDSDNKRFLKEKINVFRWVADKVLFLGDIQSYRTEVVDCRNNHIVTLQFSASCCSNRERTVNFGGEFESRKSMQLRKADIV